jgi:hypothetical protein
MLMERKKSLPKSTLCLNAEFAMWKAYPRAREEDAENLGRLPPLEREQAENLDGDDFEWPEDWNEDDNDESIKGGRPVTAEAL